MDAIDRQLLNLLQRDAQSTLAALSEAVHLSTSQVQRRIAKLEAAGVIRGYHASIEPTALGLEVIAYVEVALKNQDTEAAERFHAAVQGIDEILECHRISGDADYLLKVIAPDLKGYSDLAQKVILAIPVVNRVQSKIVFESPKQTASLPIR